METQQAIQQIIKESTTRRFVAKGLNEVARSLEQNKAVLCFLASNCNEGNYISLIEALCNESNTPLIKVDDNQMLGQWVGLCRLDEEGNPTRIVKCSCVAITQWGADSPAQQAVKNFIATSK